MKQGTLKPSSKGLGPTSIGRGNSAEQIALDYLLLQGLQLVARNYRTRRGEIDLIMRDGRCLVFVEVRFRKSSRYGSAEESITAAKCQRLQSAAEAYLQHFRLTDSIGARFDAIAVSPVASRTDSDNLGAKDTKGADVSAGYRVNWLKNILQ
ncbi:MAG: YraN family protein [Porticoccaceae bacterium]|nr:YraN family protein [Porticoccaceae bacterium]MDO7672491.1 YraN family protein [OM182 bacterium]MDP4653930.1 YraN family protein [Alphaproteobacteria bacterium]MDP4743332.1 YraN family protein [Porticoccaceae bacterium]MDP4752190.1 YraN family protein [Porticoccaceae bacterium]